MSAKHHIAQIDFGGAGTLGQFNNEDGISYEFDEYLQRQGGGGAPAVTGISNTMHKIPIETEHIKKIIDLCALTSEGDGICEGFDSGVGGRTDQILSFRKAKSRAVRTDLTDGEHITQRVTDSMLSWDSWNAPAGGANATITGALRLLSALTNSKTATLSATTVVSQAFKLGPLKFRITGDVADREPCILSATWENNITYDDKVCGGADLNNYSGIDDYEPICTVDLDDQTQAIDANGSVALTSFVIYLKAVGESDGASKHIKFTVTAGDCLPGGSNKQLRFRIRTFTIAVDQAIT